MKYGYNTLYDLYINKEFSTTDIAKIYNKNPSTILWKLKRLGIPVRHRSNPSRRTIQKISRATRGKNNPMWAGGIKKLKGGYIGIHKPDHPFCNKQGYVSEHRLVVEQNIGRYLRPEEVVHHINGNIKDNRYENLRLFRNSSEHAREHYYERGINSKGQFV